MAGGFWDMLAASSDEYDAGTARTQQYLDSLITVIVADGTVDGAASWAFNPATKTLAVSADLEPRARVLFPSATFIRRTI